MHHAHVDHLNGDQGLRCGSALLLRHHLPRMSIFLFKRLATFLATLVVASVLVFSVLELLPGNVAQVMLG